MTDGEHDIPTDDELVVWTHAAHCRDCNRCVRACPVKAIRVRDGQASIDAERCIRCGTCVRECPQQAKQYRHDVHSARRLVTGDAPAAISVAPSFAGLLEPWAARRLPSALRALGFSLVAETAVGAYHVAREIARQVEVEPDRPHIATACPAVVNYIERTRPECVPWLTPVVSPMVAHARLLRQAMGEGGRVVFVGPCVTKKDEAAREAMLGEVDVVLTFEELAEWMLEEGVDLAACEESDFDQTPGGEAALFPLAGGALRTADIVPDMLATEAVAIHGFDELAEAMDDLVENPRGVLVEALFCRHGCVNGPAANSETNAFQRRLGVLEYARNRRDTTTPTPADLPPAEADVSVRDGAFVARPPANDETPPEAEIQRVLDRTGKATPEQQLNCGACGYDTCRHKAIAVLQGLAEPEMCIPYMRRLAERRTDRIIETSPNGIVILDENRTILSMNPAFRKMFMCSESTCGRDISCLMNPEMFERLTGGEADLLEAVVKHESYHVTCHQVAYALREERQLVGIFVNITNLRENQKQLDALRRQTVQQARELLDHQVSMAQRIAEYLGESTAQGEQLLEQLMEITRDPYDAETQSAPEAGRPRKWNPPTYMSR